MSSNANVHFSSKSDEWATPQEFYDKLNAEFKFTIDAAANADNAKCPQYFTDAEIGMVLGSDVVFCNPPYSELKLFLSLAAKWQSFEATVVMLIPARTDTKAWHTYVWDQEKHQPRMGVEIRFIKGRLKFGGSKTGAPFPSAVVIFKPTK